MPNQNKRAITLNLKEGRGRELLFRMVERADVLLENFSPGMTDDLGVGWHRLREINPRLIYATGTGFGARRCACTAPTRSRPARAPASASTTPKSTATGSASRRPKSRS